MMQKLFILLLSLLPVFGLNINPDMNLSSESQFNTKAKVYFGEQLFRGNFKHNAQFEQNPSYVLKVGDIISIKIWGAYEFVGDVPVDKNGNIFIPQVGTAEVAGLKNKELQPQLSSAIKEVFNDNVQVYAMVQGYQPLAVFVSGSVNSVGLYDGFSTDSVLQFIDKAGGIIKGEGSYRHISILRNKKIIKNIDLYRFLLDGSTSSFSFQQGDVILVKPMQSYIEVEGDVSRPYIFELKAKTARIRSILKYVLPQARVNSFIHTKIRRGKEYSKTYRLSRSKKLKLSKGDKINFFSNQYVQSVSISIEGEHKGAHYISVNKGTSLYDVLKKTRFSPLSSISNIQLFRKSVALMQKQLLDEKLKDLEARALTTDSATAEEAGIRSKEAELILKFIQRAKAIEPKGQIILTKIEDLRKTLLEDGDKIFIPRKTNVVIVQGEVGIPNALTFKAGEHISYYIESCGGYTQRANKEKILLLKANGRVVSYKEHFSFISPKVEAGDSILVLSKTDSKNTLLIKDITQILYQVAVGAAVVLRAF